MAQELAYGPENLGWTPEEISEATQRLLERLGLPPELLTVSPYQLSGGEKRKVALASVLIMQPPLLVLDEPFVGLDPEAALILKDKMHGLCERGSAIFFSTHVLEVAEKLCDKIAIIKAGRLVKSGPTAELVGDSSLEDVFLELEGEK